MKKLFYIIPLFFSASIFTSCQKVINVDLNSADPKIVIEADFAKDSVCKVGLTRTVNFDETNDFPGVTGATVVLKDNLGNSETLTEVTDIPGLYLSAGMKGVPGRIYTLEVTAEGKNYSATEKMAEPVVIDSVNLKKGFLRDVSNIHVYFADPAGIDNWYRIVHYVNEDHRNSIDVTEDILRDGDQIDAMLFVGDDDTLVKGDSLTVYLRNIDEGSYKYFITLFQAEGGGDPGATPANPVSNFSNGALGYFSVYAETRKIFIVK